MIDGKYDSIHKQSFKYILTVINGWSWTKKKERELFFIDWAQTDKGMNVYDSSIALMDIESVIAYINWQPKRKRQTRFFHTTYT